MQPWLLGYPAPMKCQSTPLYSPTPECALLWALWASPVDLTPSAGQDCTLWLTATGGLLLFLLETAFFG